MAQSMGAAALPERLDAGARERRAEGMSTAEVVPLQIAHAAVDDAFRGGQAARFEASDESVR